MPTSASLVKRNMSPKILQNLEDFSIEVEFLHSLQQIPELTRRGSRNYKQYIQEIKEFVSH